MPNPDTPDKYNVSVLSQTGGLVLLCLLALNFFTNTQSSPVSTGIEAVAGLILLVWSAITARRSTIILPMNKVFMLVNAVIGAIVLASVGFLFFFAFVFAVSFSKSSLYASSNALSLAFIYMLILMLFAGTVLIAQITHWRKFKK